MKTLIGFSVALLLVSGLFAQRHGGFSSPQPYMRGGAGNVVYPGGTAATMPNITRTVPNVVYPGGGGPQMVIPGSITDPNFGQRLSGTVQGRNFWRNGTGDGWNGNGYGRRNGSSVAVIPYVVPIYVGGYGYGYDTSGYGAQPDGSAPPPDQVPEIQQQPNIIVVYPQAPPVPANAAMVAPPVETQPEASAPAEQPDSTLEPSHYLIAFQDHTIYAVVAYWVEGDTLHYFTTGNTHNQASLALVDRPLTERLNKESGIDIKLPPAPAGSAK